MAKSRLPTPASIARVQQKPADPGFTEKRSGGIRRAGPVTPKKVKPNPKPNEGVSRELYWRK